MRRKRDQLWLDSWDREASSVKDVGVKPDVKVACVFISDPFRALIMKFAHLHLCWRHSGKEYSGHEFRCF